jgi:hypothetical protein
MVDRQLSGLVIYYRWIVITLGVERNKGES